MRGDSCPVFLTGKACRERDVPLPKRPALCVDHLWLCSRGKEGGPMRAVRGGRSLPPGVLLLAAAVLALGVGLAASALRRPASPLLDPHIPNGQALVAMGLSGRPGPDQPAGPIVVDRVLVDGVA